MTLGVRGEGAGDADALFLPAGELGGIVGGAVGQTDDFEALHHASGDFFRRPACGFQREGDVAGHGAVGEQVELLEHHADVLAGFSQLGGIHGGEVLPADEDAAAVGAFQ